ncbi:MULTISPECIES: NAD-dependent epimerase/dehydratase family protein [Methylosinus]|uniref:NAD-dependent dehydratase n=1 Tax=Methylosinus trichosporium (strain ATCC 35070 / NCIMB 11131 / UNIQEM 75 / OB3b) TaxID=595536 RepID=A0A2D2CYV8_METT3|nr:MULTISPECIES: NAD-dependent epimerase/dehydratase family protein [Methylosinus]ATQ67884.1 NAD-dependent dehydratase [Methylosinus trichosporium OB3b]OBS53485.1 NAD-dependent dehydratase [Methylosinus sp. 3S-1]
MPNQRKIVVTGAAGLLGQNLIPRLKAKKLGRIVGLDKHRVNNKTLVKLHPDVDVIDADLARPGSWERAFEGLDVLVIGHAQIGGLDEKPFIDNNITATQNVLDAATRYGVRQIVHISSSVVNSRAQDFYTKSKKAQESLVVDRGLPTTVLRPTLMFGWFDRKHLGWLARFMQRTPVFPIPGNGRYLRQPLYVGDFCDVITACVETPRPHQSFNISGQEKIDYIELIRAIKAATGAKTRIMKIPYFAFWLLLKAYGLIDRSPPFTTHQLEALVTPDVFEVTKWPTIFGVRATPLAEALAETFQDPVFSHIVLEF